MGNTTLTWTDEFDRTDSSTVGNGWDTETAGLAITDGYVDASDHTFSARDRLVLLRQVTKSPHENITEDMGITAQFAVTGDNATQETSGGVVVRSKDSGGADCYIVRLETGKDDDVWTLKIVKRESGTDTDVATATVTNEVNGQSSGNDSWKKKHQVVRVRVYDEDDGVRIEAGLNDEEFPRVSYLDQSYPVFRESGYAGFEFYEAGDLVKLDRITLGALEESPVQPAEPVRLWTFGKLVDLAIKEGTRGSNTAYDREQWKDWVNTGQQVFNSQLGTAARWLRQTHKFQTKSGQTDYELPAGTMWVGDVVWDTTRENPIPIADEDSFRRVAGKETSGVPWLFRVSGTGPGGGLILKAYGTPQDSQTYEVDIWIEPPLMVDDEDVPITPQRYCPALYTYAVLRYTYRESDRSHILAMSGEFNSWVRRAMSRERLSHQRTTHSIRMSGLWRGWPGSNLTIQEKARYGVRR